MKTRPVVIHVPVVRLPSWSQVWAVVWRLLILLAILIAGGILQLVWTGQEYLIGFVIGMYWAWTFSSFGWSK